MKKFLLALIIILSLALLLTACGDETVDGIGDGDKKPSCTHNFVITDTLVEGNCGTMKCTVCHHERSTPSFTDEFFTVVSSTADDTTYQFTTEDGYTVTYVRSNYFFDEVDGGYTLVKYYGNSTNVIIPSTYKGLPVVKIGRDDGINVFENANLVSVTIPDSVTHISSYIFGSECTALRELTLPSLPDDNTISSMMEGSSYPITKVTVSSGTAIGNYYFAHCKNLKEVYIPSTVNNIKYNIFYECESLESVYFDCDIAGYCNITFNNQWGSAHPTEYAENIYLKNANDEYYTVGDVLVIPEGVTSINALAFSQFGMKTLILPDSVTSIGAQSFQLCRNLEVVVFGSGLTSIGKDGFYECSALETVYYKGTDTQWNRISIDNSDSPSNYFVFQSDKYYYSEEGDLFAYANGKEYWHFDENGMPVFWTFNITDTVDGKTFNHINSNVVISDAYWSMLEQADAMGMLEIVLDPETLFFYQNSADKDEFQQKINDNFNTAYSSLSISFTNGTIVGIDPYPASYVEVDGDKIYKTQTEEVVFTIDADGKLIWDNSNEYITVIHTFAVSE